MDPIQAWKNLTNTERRGVLEMLKAHEDGFRDRAPWQRAYEALQAISDTPMVARKD